MLATKSTRPACPICGSFPQMDYPLIRCPNCGHSEPLVDYPVSWDNHRAMSLEHGRPDPGGCEFIPDPEIEQMQQQLQELEQAVTPPEKWEGKQWQQVKQMRAEINYLRNKLNEHLDYRRKRREEKY